MKVISEDIKTAIHTLRLLHGATQKNVVVTGSTALVLRGELDNTDAIELQVEMAWFVETVLPKLKEYRTFNNSEIKYSFEDTFTYQIYKKPPLLGVDIIDGIHVSRNSRIINKYLKLEKLYPDSLSLQCWQDMISVDPYFPTMQEGIDLYGIYYLGKPIGYSAVTVKDWDSVLLYSLFVEPPYRRQHVASWFVDYLRISHGVKDITFFRQCDDEVAKGLLDSLEFEEAPPIIKHIWSSNHPKCLLSIVD